MDEFRDEFLERLGDGADGRCLGIGVRRPVLIGPAGGRSCDLDGLWKVLVLGRPLRPDLMIEVYLVNGINQDTST